MPSNHLILCHPFSSCPQSFPVSGSFQMSQLFASGGQSIRVSASASVLPMNIQDWFPLGWIPIKLPMAFFTEVKQKKIHNSYENKRSWIAKAVLRWKNGARGINLPVFRLCYKSTVINMVWYWHKTRNIDKWNRIESPEINPWIYGYLIFYKGGKNIQWNKQPLQQMVLGKLGSYM